MGHGQSLSWGQVIRKGLTKYLAPTYSWPHKKSKSKGETQYGSRHTSPVREKPGAIRLVGTSGPNQGMVSHTNRHHRNIHTYAPPNAALMLQDYCVCNRKS